MSGEPVEVAPGITVDRRVRFGKPVVKGTRITAEEVLGYLAAGMTYEEMEQEFRLSRDQLLAVLAYAAKIASEDEIRIRSS